MEEQFEDHGNGDRCPETGARHETPLPSGLDRLVVEPEDAVQGLDDVHVSDGAVRQHHDLDVDSALDLGSHRL